MSEKSDQLDQLCINTIRTLSMDAVEKAHSGHPGTPMALAPIVYLLFTRFMRHNPADPGWPDRDRFVLSCGHASMLLYSILHLTGYRLPLEELKRFRQWGSLTPGHPEYGHTPGVETTTGPLGQGCGTSVGMALAEAHLGARFNREESIVEHFTYVLCSDGDLMEGISHEAASLAGHLKLGKLIWLYDDNHITIEGDTALAFDEDVPRRFESYGWQVQRVQDVNDLEALGGAIESAQSEAHRPSLIAVRSHIAYGAPHKQDTAAAHGSPLGAEEIRAAKRFYGWPPDKSFYVPPEALAHCRRALERGPGYQASWQERFERWQAAHPQLAAEWQRIQQRELPPDWDREMPVFSPQEPPLASRAASGKILNAIAPHLPELLGGAADLAPSTKTLLAGSQDLEAGHYGERNLHFGIREHAMGAVLNGLALHGGIRPYGATFLIFSDYMRPAVRLAALMKQPVIYIWTHDSIAQGEDGPTHQPVEQLLALRAIPNMTLLRPADANETAAAWRVALEHDGGPVGLALSRQKLPTLVGTAEKAPEGVRRGAYILAEAPGDPPQLVLLASGSEVQLIVAAQAELQRQGVQARVVSMPCWELFDEQVRDYRESVLPPKLPKLAVEAGTARGWRDYVGLEGDVIGLDRFGASAPGAIVLEKLGFSVDEVVRRARALLSL